MSDENEVSELDLLKEQVASLQVELAQLVVDRDHYKNLIDLNADQQFEEAGGEERYDDNGNELDAPDNINDLI